MCVGIKEGVWNLIQLAVRRRGIGIPAMVVVPIGAEQSIAIQKRSAHYACRKDCGDPIILSTQSRVAH
jgi:hypothetical protein